MAGSHLHMPQLRWRGDVTISVVRFLVMGWSDMSCRCFVGAGGTSRQGLNGSEMQTPQLRWRGEGMISLRVFRRSHFFFFLIFCFIWIIKLCMCVPYKFATFFLENVSLSFYYWNVRIFFNLTILSQKYVVRVYKHIGYALNLVISTL